MKFLVRYIILVSLLLLLAGTVWILGQRNGNPADAVLVRKCANGNDLVLEGTGCHRLCM